jgi:hypothetical protein
MVLWCIEKAPERIQRSQNQRFELEPLEIGDESPVVDHLRECALETLTPSHGVLIGTMLGKPREARGQSVQVKQRSDADIGLTLLSENAPDIPFPTRPGPSALRQRS